MYSWGEIPDAPLDGEIDVVVLEDEEDGEEASNEPDVATDAAAMVERDGTKHRSFFMWKRRPVYKPDVNVRDKPKVGKRGIGMLSSQADKTGHNGHHMRKSLGPWLRAGGERLQGRLYQPDLAQMYGDAPCGRDTADKLYNGKKLRVASDKWITRPPSTTARAPSKLCAEAMVAAALKVRRNGTDGWHEPTWEYEVAPTDPVHISAVNAGGFYAPALARLQRKVAAMPDDGKVGLVELRRECCIENGCPMDGLASMIANAQQGRADNAAPRAKRRRKVHRAPCVYCVVVCCR